MELEAMRRSDRSWHPCRVSLRPPTTSLLPSIVIEFGDLEEEDIISDREEALRCLRYCSASLQDGGCSNIEEGEYVLAVNKNHSKTLLFDAMVEKVWRMNHSKRVFCRCTFQVKWIQSKWKWDAMTLSSSAIMKLSSKSISNHPVIEEFLNFTPPASSFDVPSCLSFIKERITEDDIHESWEIEVEKISTLIDEYRGAEEVVSGVSGANIGDCTSKLAQSEPYTVHAKKNCNKHSETQRTLQFDKEVEKHLEERAFLNPLAAQAALASLVYELPQKPELTCHMKTKSPLKERCLIGDFDASTKEELSNCSEFKARKRSNHFCEPKQAHVTSQEEMERLQTIKVSPDVLKKQKLKEMFEKSHEKKSGKPSLTSTPRNAVIEESAKKYTLGMRLTRSMIQKLKEKQADKS